MHSFQVKDGDRNTVIHHHGDYDGELIIEQIDPATIEETRDGRFIHKDPENIGQRIQMRIEFEHLKGFFAEYLRGELIGKIEDAEPDELFGLFKRI